MKSRKFNVVLLSGLSLLLALIIGISLIGIFTLNGVNRNFDEIYSNSFNMLIEAEQTYSCLICIQSAMKEAELAENPEQLNKALDEVIMHDKEISNSITYLKSVDCPNPWLDDVIAAYNDWLPIRNAELELIKHNGKPTEDLVAADNAQINLIKEKRQLFLDSEKKEIEGAHQSSDDFSSLALSTLIAISVCAIVVAVVMSLMVRSKLIKYRNKVYEEKELYRVTLESIGDGVITTDKDMNVIGLNKVAQYYTGWTEKEASGKSFREVFNITNEITGNRSKDPIEEVLVLGEKCELENHTILTSKQGDKRHIEDSAAPIKNDEGKILGVVMVFRDVSERKKMEKAIRDS